MAEIKRVSDLEIGEDINHERKNWRVERIGWAVMAAVLFAAALGLFGDGLFSDGAVGAPDGSLSLEYPRFARMEAPATLKVRLAPTPGPDGKLHLWLSGDYLESTEIERITPEPESTSASRGGVDLAFDVEEGADSILIVLSVRFEKAGRLAGRAGPSPDKGVSFNHFIYP